MIDTSAGNGKETVFPLKNAKTDWQINSLTETGLQMNKLTETD